MLFYSKYNDYYYLPHITYKINSLSYKNKIVFLKKPNIISLELFFLFKNNPTNKILFITSLIILERLSLQPFIFLQTKKIIPNFNLRKGSIVGAKATLRNFNLLNFLIMFVNFSVRKLSLYPSYFIDFNKNKPINLYINNNFSFSMNKILYYTSLSYSLDWDSFSSFFETLSFGMYYSISTTHNNYYVNRLILSHYGFYLES